jgi:hypothetical protein
MKNLRSLLIAFFCMIMVVPLFAENKKNITNTETLQKEIIRLESEFVAL